MKSSWLASLPADSLQGRVPTGPHVAQRLLRLGDRALADEFVEIDRRPEPHCAIEAGFSIHTTLAVLA